MTKSQMWKGPPTEKKFGISTDRLIVFVLAGLIAVVFLRIFLIIFLHNKDYLKFFTGIGVGLISLFMVRYFLTKEKK